MKTTTQTTETSNLVLFPAAKNFSSEKFLEGDMDELLNEYSNMNEEDIPGHHDMRFLTSEELENSELDAFDSLEAFMNRHQSQEVIGPDDKLIALINKRMDDIFEAKERIKFYLNEIEIFHPRRR